VSIILFCIEVQQFCEIILRHPFGSKGREDKIIVLKIAEIFLLKMLDVRQ
jgi:hypothetical protein